MNYTDKQIWNMPDFIREAIFIAADLSNNHKLMRQIIWIKAYKDIGLKYGEWN